MMICFAIITDEPPEKEAACFSAYEMHQLSQTYFNVEVEVDTIKFLEQLADNARHHAFVNEFETQQNKTNQTNSREKIKTYL